jgi:drug/metabolite transporter (DMT)-like permease
MATDTATVSLSQSARRGYTFALVLGATLLLWSSAFVGIRYAVRYYPPGSLALLRFLVASLLFAVYVRASGRTSTSPASLRDRLGILVLGATGVFGYHVALNFGEITVSAGTASLLVNTTPLFTVLLAALFLGERLSRAAGLGMAVACTGAVLISFGAAEGYTLDRGALLVLLAAAIQAVYFTLQKPLLTRFGALDLTARSIWCGCLLLLVFLPELVATFSTAPLSATLVVVLLGIGPSAAAYLTWAHIVSRTSVSQAVGYLYLVPALALVMGFLALDEVPSLLSLAGGGVTIGGVVQLRRATT